MGVSENVVYPIVPNGFADHYPYEKWLFHWEYTQHFQTNPHLINLMSKLNIFQSWLQNKTCHEFFHSFSTDGFNNGIDMYSIDHWS